MRATSFLLLVSPVASLTPREELVNSINSVPGLSWRAKTDASNAQKPLGSSKHLYGVNENSFDELRKLGKK